MKKRIIETEINNAIHTIKCGKEHITTLPYDLRTNDLEKLKERKDTILDRIEEVNKELDNLNKNIKEASLWRKKGANAVNINAKQIIGYYDNFINHIFKGFKFNNFFDKNQQLIKDTEKDWINSGYQEYYQEITKTISKISKESHLFSEIKYTYEDNIVKDNLNKNNDIYSKLNIDKSIQNMIKEINNLKDTASNIKKKEDHNFKYEKNLTDLIKDTSFENNLNTLNKVYNNNYKEIINQIQKLEKQKNKKITELKDYNKELKKIKI